MTALWLLALLILPLVGILLGYRDARYSHLADVRIARDERDTLVDGVAEQAIEEEADEVVL